MIRGEFWCLHEGHPAPGRGWAGAERCGWRGGGRALVEGVEEEEGRAQGPGPCVGRAGPVSEVLLRNPAPH